MAAAELLERVRAFRARLDGPPPRLATLADILTALHAGERMALNPLVTLSQELLAEAQIGTPLKLIRNCDSAVQTIAAHGLNVAAVMARLLPRDFEWAAKPVLPVLAALVMDVGRLDLGPIELHPRRSADILRKCLPESGPLADIVLAHHERPDGSGYPNGIRTIPTLAKFLAAADAYVVLAAAKSHAVAVTEVLRLADAGKLDRDFAEHHQSLCA